MPWNQNPSSDWDWDEVSAAFFATVTSSRGQYRWAMEAEGLDAMKRVVCLSIVSAMPPEAIEEVLPSLQDALEFHVLRRQSRALALPQPSVHQARIAKVAPSDPLVFPESD